MTERIIHITKEWGVDLDPGFVYETQRERLLRTAIGLGYVVALRGKHLDKLLSPPLTANKSDTARRRIFERERYVGIGDDAVPIFPDPDLPEPDTMEDIKIIGGPEKVKRLARIGHIDSLATLTSTDVPEPKFLSWAEDARGAWAALRPKHTATIQYATIPELPRIPYIRMDVASDLFGLPAVAVIQTPDDLKYGRPFTTRRVPLKSLSITASESGNPRVPDLRSPTVATNIDALMGIIEPQGTRLITRLPRLPSFVTLPEEAYLFWDTEIRHGNPFAPFAVLDVLSRSVRKTAFHDLPWEEAGIRRAESLAAKMHPSWSQLPLTPYERKKLAWEWQAAYEMDRHGTKELFRRFRMPDYLRPHA